MFYVLRAVDQRMTVELIKSILYRKSSANAKFRLNKIYYSFDEIENPIRIIKEFRSYFKVVVLTPSFCGEGSFRVIRDLSECICSEKEEMSLFWHLRDHCVSNHQLVINNSASKIRRRRRMCSKNYLKIGSEVHYDSDNLWIWASPTEYQENCLTEGITTVTFIF